MSSNDPLPPADGSPIDCAARDLSEVMAPAPYIPQLRELFDKARALHDKADQKQLSGPSRRRLALVAALQVEDIINGGVS